jgi:hypothetical protein
MELFESKKILHFFEKIKFDKKYHKFYNDILIDEIPIDNTVFIFIICQLCNQFCFKGNFKDLYFECISNRDLYIKQIKNNFRKAYLNDLFFLNIKNFFRFKKTIKEITYLRLILLLDFDKMYDNIFIINNGDNLNNFINICNELLKLRANESSSIQKVIPIN